MNLILTSWFSTYFKWTLVNDSFKTKIMTPLQRYFKLLLLDKKDVYQIIFYAIFAGLVSLSLPLGIQAIINFIGIGALIALVSY